MEKILTSIVLNKSLDRSIFWKEVKIEEWFSLYGMTLVLL